MLLLPSRAKRKRAFSARRKGLRLRLRPPTPGRALRVVQVSSGGGLQAHVHRSGAVPSDDHYDNTVREDPRRSNAPLVARRPVALSAPFRRELARRRHAAADEPPYSSGVGDGRVVRGTTSYSGTSQTLARRTGSSQRSNRNAQASSLSGTDDCESDVITNTGRSSDLLAAATGLEQAADLLPPLGLRPLATPVIRRG